MRAVTDADDDDDDADNADNAGRHSTTTRATYRQHSGNKLAVALSRNSAAVEGTLYS